MRRKLADQNATDWINSAIYLDLVQKKEPLGTKTRDLTKAFNEKFPETELDVYTDMEVTYNASILKLKSHENENNLNQDVRKVFNKALRTLKMKMSDLLLSKAFYSISEKYKEETKELNVVGNNKGSKQLHNNAVKVLLRSKQMVEAKIQVAKILKNIIKREQMRDKYVELIEKQKDQPKPDSELILRQYQDLMYLSSRIVKDIICLGDEHRNLKRPFIYNKADYVLLIHEQQTYFKDFLQLHFDLKVSQMLVDKLGTIGDAIYLY